MSLEWGNVVIAIVAMACITTIECIALFLNQDGTILGAVVAAIAGLGGYTFAKSRTQETTTAANSK